MAEIRKYSDEWKKTFSGTLGAHSRLEGEHIPLPDSVDKIVKDIVFHLSEIEENEFNGQRIKSGERCEAYRITLTKALAAAADIVNALKKNGGVPVLQESFINEHGTILAGALISMPPLEKKLKSAINSWFAAVSEDRHPEIKHIKFPLALNSTVRDHYAQGVSDIRDVLQQKDDGTYEPRPFVSNAEAQKLKLNAGAPVTSEP